MSKKKRSKIDLVIGEAADYLALGGVIAYKVETTSDNESVMLITPGANAEEIDRELQESLQEGLINLPGAPVSDSSDGKGFWLVKGNDPKDPFGSSGLQALVADTLLVVGEE